MPYRIVATLIHNPVVKTKALTVKPASDHRPICLTVPPMTSAEATYTRFLVEYYIDRLSFVTPPCTDDIPPVIKKAKALWDEAERDPARSEMLLAESNELVKNATVVTFDIRSVDCATDMFDRAVSPVIHRAYVGSSFQGGPIPTLSAKAHVEVALARPLTLREFETWIEDHSEIDAAGMILFSCGDDWDPQMLGDDGFGVRIVGPLE